MQGRLKIFPFSICVQTISGTPPPTFLSDKYEVSSPRSVKLATDIHLVSKLKSMALLLRVPILLHCSILIYGIIVP
jgi:hypothetical protein